MSLLAFQKALASQGLDPGRLDGRWGKMTAAAARQAMQLPDELDLTPEEIAEYIGDEGFSGSGYTDSLGYLTVGIGRLIDRRKGGGLSVTETLFLLSNDLAKVDAELDEKLPWWRVLSPARQKVLRNMAFNMGLPTLLDFKNTLAAMKRGDFAAAAAGMRASLWARQVGARAERLARVMEAG